MWNTARRLRTVIAVMLLGTLGARLNAAELSVGSATAAPGTRAAGAITIPANADGASTEIPVTLINGAEDGPVLALIAGIHGVAAGPGPARSHRDARRCHRGPYRQPARVPAADGVCGSA